MTLIICNKKNKLKNEENQLIILKHEVLHNTSVLEDKDKPVTSFSYYLKEA